MSRTRISILVCLLAGLAAPASAQQAADGSSSGGRGRGGFVPVTDAMLEHPDPADWLMYSRTYDAQRYSPLDEIDRGNVSALTKVWSKPLPGGVTENIPIVYRGVMYLVAPAADNGGSAVWALDATTGETLWQYRPESQLSSRVKALAIYDDMIFFTAPAARGEPSPIVALDATTGAVRWQTPSAPETHTSGAIVVDGLVLSGRTCNTARENCYIAAHDAETGEEVWRFHTSPGKDEPGDASWGGTPVNERRASTWGLPGTYDPERDLIFWGISNPMPNTRAARHGGDAAAISKSAPADLYSNSTVALRPETGELVWYYQHLPGDDWDMDVNHEKTLVHTVVDPDPQYVKWINPNIPKGVARDIVVSVGEAGGIWVNDRDTGEFIWATPFPFETSHFVLSDIDVETGATKINWDLVLDEPGKESIICYWNTRSYWPTAYHPGLNSLYVPYVNHCLDMTRAVPGGARERRTGALRPGSDPSEFAGLARIDLTTGEIHRFHVGRAAGYGAMLTTAGSLVFWGDILQKLHAFDAETGEELWSSAPLGAMIETSTISYAVDGKQYVAVVNGNVALGPRGLAQAAEIDLPEYRGNAVNVFALPDR